MKKVYVIEITGTSRNGIWYNNKRGRQYEAQLKGFVHENGRGGHTATVVFEVNPCQYVYPEDCIIISEKLVETYKPNGAKNN